MSQKLSQAQKAEKTNDFFSSMNKITCRFYFILLVTYMNVKARDVSIGNSLLKLSPRCVCHCVVSQIKICYPF